MKGQVTKQTQAAEVKLTQTSQLSPLEQDTKPRVNEGISIGVAVGQQQLPQSRQDVRPRDTEGTAAGHYDGQSCLSFKSQSQYPLENMQLADKTEDGYRRASVSIKTNMAQLHKKAADYQHSLPVDIAHGFADNIYSSSLW